MTRPIGSFIPNTQSHPDPNGINRANAANALGEVGEQHGGVIKDAAVPMLIDMVERGDGGDQYAALKALRGFGPHAKAAIPALRKMLQSPDVQKTWIAQRLWDV